MVHVDIGCSAKISWRYIGVMSTLFLFILLQFIIMIYSHSFSPSLPMPLSLSFYAVTFLFFLLNLSTMSHHPCQNRESGVASTGFTLT